MFYSLLSATNIVPKFLLLMLSRMTIIINVYDIKYISKKYLKKLAGIASVVMLICIKTHPNISNISLFFFIILYSNSANNINDGRYKL